MSLPSLSHVLNQLGLTRVAVLYIAGFFLTAASLEQFLPDGEALVRLPSSLVAYIMNFGLVLALHALICEFSKPKILVRERKYWVSFAYLFVGLNLYFVFCCSFGYVKSMIPVIHPYGIDPTLHRIETALFFGVSPSQWWVAHIPAFITRILAYFYLSTWFSVTGCYFVWHICLRPSESRTMCISTSYGMWIVAGILAATIFSSVGPTYYHYFYHDSFAPAYEATLNTLLANQDEVSRLMFVDVRKLLLDFHEDSALTHLNGISSMPSLHTGLAFQIAVHSHFYRRRIRWLAYGFALFTFIGSFALGWHYIIDSVVSALVLWGVWTMNRRSVTKRATA